MNEPPPAGTRRRSRSRSKGRSSPIDTKPIRLWCPGSYDTLHFGYISFLRKVKQEMTSRFPKVELVAGLYTDEDMLNNDEQPVFSLDERYEMLRANKWVDEIVKGASCELSKRVLKEYNCDYAFYSGLDDLPNFDEKLRDELLECGLLKMVTMSKHEYPGITASHIVNRMMLLEQRDENNNTISGKDWAPRKFTFPDSISCKEIISFATTSSPSPKPTDKVVYMEGSFDVLHPGHLQLLEKARGLGDFLYVGLHSDETISNYAGSSFPIMQWNERLVALLACKYVSEVVIDAPFGVDDSLMDALSVNYVVPSLDDYGERVGSENAMLKTRYEVAKKRKIFHELTIDKNSQAISSLTTMDILNRIHQNWSDYSYVADKSSSDVESDLDEVNLSQNRDDGDVLKFPSPHTNAVR